MTSRTTRKSHLMRNRHATLKTIDVGNTQGPKPDPAPDRHLVEEAIKKGEVKVRQCPPGTKGRKRDERNRPGRWTS